ncbi:MAG: hypothetical protein GY705_12490, partial [Bacteroidetes bacterium]|nr:hypothetical protein [Bacteroidota bacterium]
FLINYSKKKKEVKTVLLIYRRQFKNIKGLKNSENQYVIETQHPLANYYDTLTIIGDSIDVTNNKPSFIKLSYDTIYRHFPYENIWHFNVGTDSLVKKIWANHAQFPDYYRDSLSTYLCKFNSNYLGYNYSLNSLNNGNYYIITSMSGDYGCNVFLYPYSETHGLNPYYLQLSGSWGDEAQYDYSYGKFINDSIYHKTILSGDEGFSDSIIIEYLIDSNAIISEIKKTGYGFKY